MRYPSLVWQRCNRPKFSPRTKFYAMATVAALRPAADSNSNVVGALACQKNSYLRSLDTEVISCIQMMPQKAAQPAAKSKNKGNKGATGAEGQSKAPEAWLIECADSVLFPEGGGQPTDHGTLQPLSDPAAEPISIKFVQRQGLHCVCHSPVPLQPGTAVRQEIDFKRRWDHMQQHTGQHLLTAVMNTYDMPTVGWGMGAENEMSYIDVPRKPTDEELQEVQDKCNEVIQNSIGIRVETPDDANISKLPDDYDKDMGVIRVVKIGDMDNNTCCGTHLQKTSHINLILMGPVQPVKTRFRVSFIAGERAIRMASSAIQTTRSIGRLLSSAPDSTELLGHVNRMKDNVADLKKKETQLLADIAGYEAARVKTDLEKGNSAFVYRAVQGLDFANVVAAQVKESIKEGSVIVLASGEGDKGGQVMVTGHADAVASFTTKIKETLPSIKGGGKGERWQGKVAEWKKGDLEALEKLTTE